MSEVVTVERAGGVAVVTLNRPKVLNALDAALRDGLIAALGEADADASVKAVVLTGAGDRAFCAGQDLAVSTALTADTVGDWFRPLHGFYQAIRAMTKPTVAALNGVAAGAGFQAALWCDLRVAHPGVRMGQPEVAAGLASVIGAVVMRETIGLARTQELSLSCRLIDAEEARRYGLVTEIVPRDRVLSRAIERAEELAKQPPLAVALTKRRIAELTQAAYDDAIEASVSIQAEAYRSGEPQAAAAAFLARRKA